jgi:hypothetical protein
MTVEPIRAALSGSDRCAAEGLTATAAAPMLALCRMLVTAGHDPARPLHAYRGDVLCLRVSSIGWGARRTVRDNSCGTPTLARWYDRAAGMFAAPPVAQTARPLGGPILGAGGRAPAAGVFLSKSSSGWPSKASAQPRHDEGDRFQQGLLRFRADLAAGAAAASAENLSVRCESVGALCRVGGEKLARDWSGADGTM